MGFEQGPSRGLEDNDLMLANCQNWLIHRWEFSIFSPAPTLFSFSLAFLSESLMYLRLALLSLCSWRWPLTSYILLPLMFRDAKNGKPCTTPTLLLFAHLNFTVEKKREHKKLEKSYDTNTVWKENYECYPLLIFILFMLYITTTFYNRKYKIQLFKETSIPWMSSLILI